MRLTIETDNISELEQLLNVFKTMNLDNIQLIAEDSVAIDEDVLRKINLPIRKKLNLDEIKKAKNYKGVNRERFNALVKETNIAEPIDVLVAQLSR